MRKLYNEFFGVLKEGKVSEKTMFTYVAATVVIIVVCLTAMSLTAYAYFTADVGSSTSKIMAANYDLDIEIVKIVDESTTEKVLPKETEDICYTLSEGTYVITMKQSDQTTASTGYCGMKLSSGTTIYTQQIGVDQSGNPEPICFTFENTGDPLDITFVPNWGTCVLNASTATQSASVKEGNRLITYEIKNGDFLYGIAVKHGIDLTFLATFNDIKDPNLIYPGQIICIPVTDENQ